jgi:hypothetical protein
VDETTADFVEPDCIAEDAELHQVWLESILQAHTAYCRLVEGLQAKYAAEPDDLAPLADVAVNVPGCFSSTPSSRPATRPG